MDSEEEIEKIAEKLAHDQGWSKLKHYLCCKADMRVKEG
jgi:hypothetical protein